MEKKKPLKKVSEIKVNGNKVITSKDQLKYFNSVIAKMLEGRSKSEIITHLTELQLSEQLSEVIYEKAIDYYTTRSLDEEELASIVSLHTMIYEDIILFAEKVGRLPLKLKAMEAKEKLLGFHTRELLFELNQENNVEIIEVQDYSVEKLSDVEKVRYLELKKKLES